MSYRIAEWSTRFENSSSRKLKRLDWVAIPNSMDIEGYIILVDHPDGAAHFGAWIALIQIASKQFPRGNLPNGKTSQSLGGICQSLGRISRLPVNLFEELLPRLIEIGWVEILGESANVSGGSADASGDFPSTSGKSADTDIHTNKHRRESSTQESSSSKKQNIYPPNPLSSNGNHWGEFTEAYVATGHDSTPADFTNAKTLWNKLGLADQIACVSGIGRDVKLKKYSGPEFWPKPRKYIHEREWERNPGGPVKTKSLAERIGAK
jgi:hypothetical protein